MTRQELLASIPLFESLTKEDLEGLTLRLEEGHYQPGEVVFRHQRIADRVARFGGSWPFIITFSIVMTAWMAVNVARVANFDPYPFILLNLALSSVAALQAPIIMMSQNRQAAKDKLLAENDYQVNLKAEMEIAALLRG